MYPTPHLVSGFRRWGFACWLRYYVEDHLTRLPFFLSGSTLGAVIATAVAVSEPGTVRVGRVVAAAAPSVPDLLWPAVAGAVGGVLVLAAVTALWGACSYFRGGDDRGGDHNWEAHVAPQVSGKGNGVWTYLSKKPKALVVQSQLGRIEVVTRWPSGAFYRSMVSLPATHQHAIVGTPISNSTEPGTYLVRWYATEHKARLHEVARAECTVS